MKFYFLDEKNEPISYEPSQSEFSCIKKGRKEVITMKADFWESVALLGGVVDVPEHCGAIVTPTSDNQQTIGMQFTVKVNGATYTGFGSSNDFTTTKISKTFQDYETGQDKTTYSGSACYALEMAVKRAKKNAIAMALGLPHGEVSGQSIYSVLFIKKGLKDSDVVRHFSGKDIRPDSDSYDNQTSYNKPSYNKPSYQQAPAQESKSQNAVPAARREDARPATPASTPAVNNEDVSDPETFVIPIGSHKGRTLLDMVNGKPKDREWFSWALTNLDKPKDAKLVANIKAIMSKYAGLFANNEMQQEERPTASNNVTATTDHRELLRKTWTARGYETITPEGKEIVKSAIETALNSAGLKWEAVTDAQAKQILDQIDVYFPQKTKMAPIAADKASDSSVCAECGKKLMELEVQFCTENGFQDNYCFDHQGKHIPANA
jgi:hypothetical protein